MKWLDKYDAPKAQNGIEGTMSGLTDKGFNYNGAWGGQFQKGGSMFKNPSIVDYVEPTYSYPLRDKLYPGEDEYFKANPHVGGMAAEDNSVIINPYSKLTDQQKEGIRINETARLAMRNGYRRPDFELTPEQQEAFKNYSTDIQDQKETIIGRILSGDTSAGNVTPEQKKYAEQLKKVLKLQNGDAIGSRPEDMGIREITEFEKAYINSPRFTELSRKQGDTPEITQRRRDTINNFNIDRDVIRVSEGPSYISADEEGTPKFYLSPDKGDWPSHLDINAHEMGHFPYNTGDLNFPENTYREIQSRNKEFIKSKKTGVVDENIEHDINPNEVRADKNQLLYQLKKLGIYDATKDGDINQEQLDEFKNSGEWNRLQRLYDDADILWLINNVAQNTPNKELNIAQTGNSFSKTPTRLPFENELMSRVITERNKDKNFVKRALYPYDYPYIQNEDESKTTHLMQHVIDEETGNSYIQPTVIQNKLGLLDKLTATEADEYAINSGEEIMIPDVQLASYYSKNGLIKHATGGSIPGSVGFTYARTQGIPSEGPYAKKTMPSAQNGVDMYGNPIIANIRRDESVARTNYNPRTNTIMFGSDLPLFLSPEILEKTLAHENRHAWQFANDRTNFNIVHNPEYAFEDRLMKKPEQPSTDEVFENYHNRKAIESGIDVKRFKESNPSFSYVPNQIIYDKVVDDDQYENPESVEGEAEYYQETGQQFQNGGEMKYYQHGLDFKPKGMKNGGWLDSYDVPQAQDGFYTPKKLNTNAAKKILKNINKRKTDTTGIVSGLKSIRERETIRPTVARDNTRVKSTFNERKFDPNAKNKTDEEIAAERKARIADSMAAQKESYNSDNWRELLARETQATGDKLRISLKPNFFDDYLNPAAMIGDMASGLGQAPYLAKETNSYLPYVVGIGAPLLTGALEGIGAKNNKEFINNLINPLNIVPGYKSAEKYAVKKLKNIPTNVVPKLEEAIPATSSIKSNLKKGIEKMQLSNTYKAINEHMSGLERGLFHDKRPFFEKFPITQAQKAKVYAAQDQALEEGKQFIKDWHYGDDIDLHPDIVKKMQEIDPNFKLSIFDNTNITDAYRNPFAKTKDALVLTRRNALKNENISDEAKQYVLNKRTKIGGVNLSDTNESLTLRNAGLYYYPPSEIKDTVIHEAGHTSEHLGTATHYGPDRKLVIGSKPFDNIRTYDPDFTGYYMANPNTKEGKLFQEAMVEPVPHVKDAQGKIIKEGNTWEASPGELHSELLPARSNLIDSYVAQGYDRKEIMDMLRADASDAQIDWMIDNKNLNRFFKPTTSPELKRKVIRMLYAGVPAAVGLDALTNPTSEGASSKMKKGGVIKDDMGQWAHPGEITEINSPYITMKGVPYPVLGISNTGDMQMMYPEEEYEFDGDSVTEYPMAKNGINNLDARPLRRLDDLTNFTNYNSTKKSGWLSKYE